MKIVTKNIFVDQGEFVKTDEFKSTIEEIEKGIYTVTWGDKKKFIINPIKNGNGVVPIKINFINHLVTNGWEVEKSMSLVSGISPGPIDAIKKTKFGLFAVEWETGNVSSSHRALNKIAIGIIQKNIIGGILIVPKRSLAKYLTDRIGNYEEIEPYFPLYRNIRIDNGFMGVISIEHDDVSKNVYLIPKGKDGNAPKPETVI